MNDEVTLKVITYSLIGDLSKHIEWIPKRMAHIPYSIFKHLNLSPGDCIEIKGRKDSTIAEASTEVSTFSVAGSAEIKIDMFTAEALGVRDGDTVSIRKVECVEARRVILVVEESELLNVGLESALLNPIDLAKHLKDLLILHPLMEGDIVPYLYFGKPIKLKVILTEPSQPVIVTKSTEVIVKIVSALTLQKCMDDYGSAKDVLETIVACALLTLGFTVKVDHKVDSKAGTKVEVDVLGMKVSKDIRFIIYVSCKNWDREVDVSVIREEIGRVEQLAVTPGIRIIVAPKFTKTAKDEAVTSGFIVIEIGEKATKENFSKVYQEILAKLYRIFSV